MGKSIERGKMKVPPASEVVEYMIRPGLEEDLSRSYQTYLNVNMAHVLMLASTGIISEEAAKAILGVNLEMVRMGDKPTFPIDPNREDIYFNLENYLIQKVGVEIGGQQHTARSRNDLCATVSRIDVRTRLISIFEDLLQLRKALIGLAQENFDAVMPGHTHLQPSEPITFAHYLNAINFALDRDCWRLLSIFQSLNRCPLGGTSMGSSTFPINRQMTSDLLGFSSPLDNSLDCVASRDYVLEAMSAFDILGGTLNRLCNDLYVWATPYYRFIEVDDSVAACSSIMPQKKNPWTLEYIKGKMAHLEGLVIESSVSLRSTPYTHCQDVSVETLTPFWKAADELKAGIKLLGATLRGLKTNKEFMYRAALDSYCTVTELANTLVRIDALSFRTAHGVVAAIVNHMLQQRKLAHEISLAEIQGIYKEKGLKSTRLKEEDVKKALDPSLNVMSKHILGGTAIEEVQRQLDKLNQSCRHYEEKLQMISNQINEAKKRLDALVSEKLNS